MWGYNGVKVFWKNHLLDFWKIVMAKKRGEGGWINDNNRD